MNQKTLSVIFTQIFTVIIMLGLSGCASPYKGQIDALNASYEAGRISSNDYQIRMAELKRLELENAQAMLMGMQNIANQQEQQRQQQQAAYQQNLENQQRQQMIDLQRQQFYQQQYPLMTTPQEKPKTYRIRDQWGNEKTVTVEPQ